jgi:uncharacterized protein YcbK (DUF882 family)
VSAAPARPGRFFTYAEFVGQGGCASLSPAAKLALADLCARFLDPLRMEFGVCRVYSGCRSREHNRSVGGAPNSMHMYAAHPGIVAADVACARGRPADWERFLERRSPGGLGAYATHVHVDNRPGRARW